MYVYDNGISGDREVDIMLLFLVQINYLCLFYDEYSAVASPLVVKQKAVSPKATSPPERNQQDLHSPPAVPVPDPVKAEHSFEETIFKVCIFV